MTRLLIALIAASALSVLATKAPHRASATPQLLTRSTRTEVVTRRVHEGSDLTAFWRMSVSPDGRYLTQTNGPGGTLVAFDLLHGTRQPITRPDDGFHVQTTGFSPDGHIIAYTGLNDSTGGVEVRVINVDGSDQRVIWRAMDDPLGAALVPSAWPGLFGWTPDGTALLVGVWVSNNVAELWLMPVDGSPRRLLYEPSRGIGLGASAVSPDGRYIAFSANTEMRSPETPDPNGDVYVLPLTGEGQPVPVAPSPAADELVGWTRDGRILFVSDRELTEGLWSINVRDGRPAGEPTLVKGDLWGIRPIGMAGDLVFYGITTQVSQVHTLDLSLEGRRLVGPLRPVEAEMRPSAQPAWSPDGRRLAYSARANPDGPQFLVIRSTSGDAAQEFGGFQRIQNLGWERTGSEINIRGELPGDDQRRWLVFDMNAGSTREGTNPGEGPWCPLRLHPDGSRQFCVETGQEGVFQRLIEVDVASRKWKVLWEVEAGSELTYPTLSPDGSRLAVWEFDGPDGTLHVVPVDGGDPTDVLKLTRKPRKGVCWGLNQPLWTPDGEHLLTDIPRAVPEGEQPGRDACQLQLVPVSGRAPITIGSLPAHGAWDLSPDGTRLALVAGEPRGEIWVLEGVGR